MHDDESHTISINVTTVNVLFNSSFILHYTQTLHYFVSTYKQLPYDEENLGRFEYESHNFAYLLEQVHHFNAWTVKPLVDLTRALICDLMLEIFARTNLLKVGGKMLVIFEGKMDDISAEIGALEALNTYRDLVLVLRKWIQSFPESDCKDMCAEVFVQERFATRVESIDKQLAKTNFNRHDYYRDLHFPYFEESICFSYCLHFFSVSIEMAIFCIFCMMVIAVVMVITRRRHVMEEVVYLIQVIFVLSFSVLLDLSITLSVNTVLNISLRSNGFLVHVLRRTKKHETIKTYLTFLYYGLFLFLLLFAFRKDLIVTNFFVFYTIISGIPNLFSTKSVLRKHTDILHAVTLLFLVHSYLYEFETLHYLSSCILSFTYPYWAYVRNFINCNFVINFIIVYSKIDKYQQQFYEMQTQ